MIEIEEWKRIIVRFFISRSTSSRVYKITDEKNLHEHFKSKFERNTQSAYEELLVSDIITSMQINEKTFYTLNFDKQSEIEEIIKNDKHKSNLIKPSYDELKELKEEFRDVPNSRSLNKSFYYFYTKIDEPDYWTVFIKSKPNTPPYKIILGSISDKNSRISKIWQAVIKVSNTNNDKPFIRKWVENIEQKACGNNRLPSKCAFRIFIHLNWLKIVHQKGRVNYYKISK